MNEVVVVDCSTGEVTTRQATADELAAQEETVTAQADADASREQAAAIIQQKAASDPAFAALCTLLGISTAS